MLSALALSVAVSSPSQPLNSRCGSSPELTGDILTSPETGKATVITAIAVVRERNGRVVGWIYNDSGGGRLAQVLPTMSKADRSAANILLQRGDRYSAFTRFPVLGNPWHDLTIRYCLPGEMISGKHGSVPR